IGNGRYAGIVVLAEVVCTVITAAIAIRIDAVTHEISFPPRFSLAIWVGFTVLIRVGCDSESFILQIFNRIMLLRHLRHLLRSVLPRSVQWDPSPYSLRRPLPGVLLCSPAFRPFLYSSTITPLYSKTTIHRQLLQTLFFQLFILF